jgi:hypothetical protein
MYAPFCASFLEVVAIHNSGPLVACVFIFSGDWDVEDSNLYGISIPRKQPAPKAFLKIKLLFI